MALILREIALELEESEDVLPHLVARQVGLPPSGVLRLKVLRRSFDARKKPRILKIFTVRFETRDEEGVLHRNRDNHRLARDEDRRISPPNPLRGEKLPVLVTGMGPAGLFAALRLTQHGFRVLLVEQGRPVEERVTDVRNFWDGKGLDPESNVQFGEGGAGTFSDGKLTTRINDPWMRLVLETLVGFGAPEVILTDAKPHIGTDRLRLVLINFRRALLEKGVEIRYQTRLTELAMAGGEIGAGILNDVDEYSCGAVVLAPGHSARSTYEMLCRKGVRLESRPFAIGVRVEHPAALVDRIQYGVSGHPLLPSAEYALRWNDEATGRGVYSFCMCPGGRVVLASSEPEGVVVNGMSFRRRDDVFSNSALVVSVRPADFGDLGPLGGIRFQKYWEKKAYHEGGGDYHAPAQNMMKFMGRGVGPVTSTCRPGVREADLERVLPDFVTEALRKALPRFGSRMPGFLTAEATLVGIESRTSAPVRIVRGEDGQSLSHPGLYPAGEGAGYAGGIMSAAVDGIRAAEHVVENYPKKLGSNW